MFANCREMGKNDEKWLRNGDFFSFFTYGYPNIVYYGLLDVLTKFQVNWSTKTRFIWIIVFSYFSTYGNPEMKMLNGKKSSLFAKNEKVFVLLIRKFTNIFRPIRHTFIPNLSVF